MQYLDKDELTYKFSTEIQKNLQIHLVYIEIQIHLQINVVLR